MIDLKKHYKNLLIIVVFVFVLGIAVNVRADSNMSCSGIFGPDFIPALKKYVYAPIKWLTPSLLLVLTAFDFAKIVFNGKKEDMDKAKNNFLKRSVAAFIIFFAPDIINLLVEFVQERSIASCMNDLK